MNGLSNGHIRVLVGTHAVIQKGVEFRDLGLVVIDEQQRFGVAQRATLVDKGDTPDVLVMTATPIPRSLAMTLYGDLDLSVIDQMPPGRKQVTTIIRTERSRREVFEGIRRQVARRSMMWTTSTCPACCTTFRPVSGIRSSSARPACRWMGS